MNSTIILLHIFQSLFFLYTALTLTLCLACGSFGFFDRLALSRVTLALHAARRLVRLLLEASGSALCFERALLLLLGSKLLESCILVF